MCIYIYNVQVETRHSFSSCVKTTANTCLIPGTKAGCEHCRWFDDVVTFVSRAWPSTACTATAGRAPCWPATWSRTGRCPGPTPSQRSAGSGPAPSKPTNRRWPWCSSPSAQSSFPMTSNMKLCLHWNWMHSVIWKWDVELGSVCAKSIFNLN